MADQHGDELFYENDSPITGICVRADARWQPTGLLHPNGRPLLKRVTPAIGFRADHSITEYAPDYD